MLEILGAILSRAARDLDDTQARYALIGGLAIGARTVLRFTQDTDLAEVPSLLGLITRRGFANDKDLRAVYQSFLDRR